MNQLIGLLFFFITYQATAAIVVQDDSGQMVTLQKPAERVIAFSPGITELIFAAGGGNKLVGVSKFSDYPAEAKRIPVIGDSRELDLERIIKLKPDLFVVWRKGSSAKQVEQLRKMGIPLFFIDEQKLVDIPNNIQQLGQLMDTGAQADQAANDLLDQLAALAKKYTSLSPVRLFYQVWSNPLFTLNGQQIVSDAVRLCGGVNVFANQKITAPTVSVEAVLQKNPEAIVGTNDQHSSESVLAIWKRYPTMTAVKQGNLFELESDLINRAGPRMVLGVADLCDKLDQARKHRRS